MSSLSSPPSATAPISIGWKPRPFEKPTKPELRAVRQPARPAATETIPSTREPLVSLDFAADDDEVPTLVPREQAPFSHSWTKLEHAALIRLDGPHAGSAVVLPQEGVRIGRSRDADVRLDDDGVSRFHAAIQFTLGTYEIVDLSSRNGTAVHGAPVVRRRLADGDILQLGPRATFRFCLMDENQADNLRQLYEASVKDPLTGAYNRQHLEERLRSEIAFAVRHRSDVAALLLDIDHFKVINDTHGHQAGDAVLQFVSGTVMSRLRTEDLFARYGGEEFIVLLRGIDLHGAARAGERLRAVLAASSPTFEGRNIPLTVSIGCSSLTTCEEATSRALIACADRRLYAAKRAGRNRVMARDE
jgi:two-component system, cell cycle response regulator